MEMNKSDIDRPETLEGLVFNDSNEIENDPESEYPKNTVFIQSNQICDVTPIKVKSSTPLESFSGQFADSSSHTYPMVRSPFEPIEELKEKTSGILSPKAEIDIMNKREKEIAVCPEKEENTRKMRGGGRKPCKLRMKDSGLSKLIQKRLKEDEGNTYEDIEEEEKHRYDSDSEFEWDTEANINEKLTITDLGCDFCTRLGIVCATVKICTDCIRTKLSRDNS